MSVQLPSLESEKRRPSKRVIATIAGCILVLIVFGYSAIAFADVGISKTKHLKRLPPLARVATLPHKNRLHPSHTDQRLIIVGDVHGMYDELMELMDKVEYHKKKDSLVFLGDMITKGYDSLGVVDFAIDEGAFCVRGNHEDEVLSIYADHYNIDMPKTYPPFATPSPMTAGDKPKPTLKPTQGPEVPAKNSLNPNANYDRDISLVKQMKKRHVKYLASCPAILQFGKVSKRGVEAVGVHGGLLWDELDLEKQDIYDVLRIRSIVPPDYSYGSENPDDGIPWFGKWNDEQSRRKKENRLEVFYGHDASKGLQLHRYSKGLDTKCQRGGKLSAYVVTVADDGHYHEELVQIDCKGRDK